jgi:hypothetical protein
MGGSPLARCGSSGVCDVHEGAIPTRQSRWWDHHGHKKPKQAGMRRRDEHVYIKGSHYDDLGSFEGRKLPKVDGSPNGHLLNGRKVPKGSNEGHLDSSVSSAHKTNHSRIIPIR